MKKIILFFIAFSLLIFTVMIFPSFTIWDAWNGKPRPRKKEQLTG